MSSLRKNPIRLKSMQHLVLGENAKGALVTVARLALIMINLLDII